MFPQVSGTSPSPKPRSIAFVDNGISDADNLIEGLSDHHVIQLPTETSGIEAITQALSQYQNLDSIHVFSHGKNGSLQLGNSTLSQTFLSEYQNDLASWGQALTGKGDLLFYGCDFAAGGDQFIEQISQVTGADVAASNDLTGKDGDWELEVVTGDIDNTTLAVETYEGNLAAITVDTRATRYDYDFGTSDSPLGSPRLRSAHRPTTWQRITPEAAGDISWSGEVNAVDRGSIAGVNAINQDFVYASEARTLSHKIANGVWDVVVNMGDATAAHDNMQVSAEGILLNDDLDNGVKQFPYGGGKVAVTDGVLDLKFEDLGGVDPDWVLSRLSLTRVGDVVTVDTSATRYDYDFGTSDSPLGSPRLRSAHRPTTWQRITPEAIGDISWSGEVNAVDRGSIGGVNAINQDIVFSSEARTLSHKISNGVWDVVVNMGDATAAHDRMQLSAEGIVLNDDIISGTKQFPYGGGRVEVTDGVLDLTFADLGGTDPNWVLSRLSLTKVGELGEAVIVDTNASRYDYDFGTPDSPIGSSALLSANRPTTWQRISPKTLGDISWSAAVNAIDRGSIGGVNAINQDFVSSSGVRTLSHKISNGVWDVVVNMGDAATAHDNMRVSAEGIVLNEDIDNGVKQFPYGLGRVEVTDGVLDLKVEDLGGDDPNWVLNRLSLTKVGSLNDETVDTTLASYYYDFGSATSPVASSTYPNAYWQRITPETTGDIRWSGDVNAADRGEGTNDINRDFVYASGSRTLSHKIDNGLWQVALVMGDTDFAHDRMQVSVEGNILSTSVDRLFADGVVSLPNEYNSAAGQFLSVGSQNIFVTDGELDITFNDLGGDDPNWVVNRLSLVKILDLPDAEESTPGLSPDGSGFTQTTLATGFEQPTAFAYADDGRVFVSEKAGRIKVVENGEVVSTFIDISDEVDSTRDRGLIGFALDPDFETNGWVYFHFSEAPTGDNVAEDGYGVGGQLIKVKASTENPNVADLSTREVILGGHLTTGGSHTVGDVDFDNDGNLIFSWGDGGFSQDLRIAAQNPDSQQGKFFRIDPDTGFGVPENPYYDPTNPDSIRSKVWVTGVRNAWRWTVDRLTGDVYFGDVTDGGPEEANIIRANATDPEQLNFGWPYFQGDNPTRYGTPPSGFESEDAYIELPHVGRYDAITGGAVYRGSAYPEIYDGRYFFANFGQDVFYTGDADGNFQQFGTLGDFRSPADIQVAPNGTIQYLSMFDGAFYQLNYDPATNQPLIPNAEATASVTAGAGPLTVNFSSVGSNSPNGNTLTYGWDFDADGSIDSTAANPSYTYDTVGQQTATLTVIDGAGAVDTTKVEITVTSDQPTDGNLAFGKPTIQSSTTQGAIASRAVDGNTDNAFINGSVTATTVQDKAFWEIDLGAVYDLSSVQIFVGSQPLSNYFVFTSENEFVGGNFNALFTEPDVWYYQNEGEVNDEETVAINQTGRYLRIQLADIGIVSLAEVKILGTPI